MADFARSILTRFRLHRSYVVRLWCTAGEAFVYRPAERREFRLPRLLSVFQQAKAVAHHLARRGVAPAPDEAANEFFVVIPERVAGRHGYLLSTRISLYAICASFIDPEQRRV
jgi:hypothetical protein